MAYINIDFNAYKHNLEFLAQKIGDIKKLFAVLKDNAYGHGIEEMSPLAAAIGIQYAVVKDTKEALKASPFFKKVLILIEANPKNALLHEKLIYSACSLESLEQFNENINIHLKIDTGMRRNGVKLEEIKKAFEIIKRKKLNLSGVFTHFYGADMLGSDFFVQERTWLEAKNICQQLCKQYGLKNIMYHSKNSAALLRSQKIDDEFARVGIASYGYVDLNDSFGRFPLKPVLSLWAEKISTRTLKKDEKLGYSGAFIAKRDMIVSTYDIGYGDGFFRVNEQKKLTLAHKAVLGRMCMDCFSLESTLDEICLFDDVSEIAKHFNTITYEILARLSPYLTRNIIHQSE